MVELDTDDHLPFYVKSIKPSMEQGNAAIWTLMQSVAKLPLPGGSIECGRFSG